MMSLNNQRRDRRALLKIGLASLAGGLLDTDVTAAGRHPAAEKTIPVQNRKLLRVDHLPCERIAVGEEQIRPAEVRAFAEEVWPLVAEEPDVARWADVFLERARGHDGRG